MKIHGLQKMTLLDFPGRVACTVFFGGCDMRCPYCHNAELLDGTAPAVMDDAELLAFLKKRQGLLDGVCFTGGEPLVDLDRLDELVAIVRRSHGEVKIYANTSLNLTEEQESRAIEYLHLCGTREDKINGISVSLPYADVEMFNAKGYAALKSLLSVKPWPYNFIRVNSVIRGNEGSAQMRKFITAILEPCKEFGVWSINFRKDYTECTQANLNDCHDPFMDTLMGMRKLSRS